MGNLQNDLIIRAAKGLKVERTPVWVMRQAGRVLAPYRAVRQQAGNFINLVKTPELAAEVTIQPVDILGVDAAILFSDILVVPEAMGLPYTMDEGRGPWFENTIRSEKDLLQLSSAPVTDHLAYVTDAIGLIKRDLNGRVPLIGFAGAPWTIFCYMVEGRGSKTFSLSRAMLQRDPNLAHDLLSRIADATIQYLKAQVEAGVDMLQLFDSWAGILNSEVYNVFIMPYMHRICEAMKDTVPLTIFAKGAFFSLKELSDLRCNTIGLDWHTSVSWARQVVGEHKTLQGNLDPAVLYGSFEQIKTQTHAMLDAFGEQRHIANLGHGVYPDIDAEHLKCFIESVKEYQYKLDQ
jgi:uroporphyrinogen decarboxylase